MGNGQHYLKSGGFRSYFYVHKETITAGGLTAKVIAWYNTKDFHDSLPMFSNTSKLYMRYARGGKQIIQLRVFEGRKPVLDFDWGHPHRPFKEGIVHVHIWKNGRRMSAERLMNNAEMKRYGALIKKACSKAKFR
mgnify:CR=1 FL=1